MQKGIYQLPYHKDRKVSSLLWDNSKDRNFEEAIKELQFKMNGIEQVVIKITPNSLTYATNQIIKYFMNQHWDRGIRYTNTLDNKGNLHTIAIRTTANRYKTFIPILYLIIDNHVYSMKPQMHIYPGEAEEMYAEPYTFQAMPVKASASVVTYTAQSEYAAYKFIMKIVEPYVEDEEEYTKFTPEPEPTHDFTMFRPICEAYEIDYHDPKAFEQIEYYVQNRIPITRMPQDDEVYNFLVELGIAPSAEELYNDENFIYIGKEEYLETYEDYN